MNEPKTGADRRPIQARSSAWAVRFAARLARTAVTPNQISVASVAFAGLGAWSLLAWEGWPGLVLAAAAIQLRLVCNLLDGMVAVEGGKQSPLGALYNEFPDRVADSLLLVAWGYAAAQPWLGWLAALLATLTAYVRVFGGALGLAQSFIGPMAKQHRMAVMTVACLTAALECVFRGGTPLALQAGLWLAAAGSAWTCVARSRAIARQLV